MTVTDMRRCLEDLEHRGQGRLQVIIGRNTIAETFVLGEIDENGKFYVSRDAEDDVNAIKIRGENP